MFELLKEILEDTSKVTITNTEILFNGTPVESNAIVDFKLCNKAYDVRSVILFIQDRNIKHVEYMKMCKNFNVKPLALTDKEKVVEEISLFRAQTVDGEFVRNKYKIDRKYNIPMYTECNYILVSFELKNEIGLNNVEEFFVNKHVKPNTGGGILAGTTEFMYKDMHFKVFNDFYSFTEEDWSMVKVMFIDGIERDVKMKCKNYDELKENAVFVAFDKVEDKNIKVFVPNMNNEKEVTNFDVLWNKLEDAML